LQAFTEGLIEEHIATDIIITISGWAGPLPPAAGRGAWASKPSKIDDLRPSKNYSRATRRQGWSDAH
jgi:hypothetical protein